MRMTLVCMLAIVASACVNHEEECDRCAADEICYVSYADCHLDEHENTTCVPMPAECNTAADACGSGACSGEALGYCAVDWECRVDPGGAVVITCCD